MLQRTEAIIYKSSSYGDSDLIITAFTFDKGLIKVFAKSPLKLKSRFGSALEPFSYNKISFWGKEDSALPRLTQADIIHPFQRLRDNIDCFLKVTELLEITQKILPEKEPNKELFYIMLHTMRAIENENFSDRRYLFYKIKLLAISGFSPQLKGCAFCSKEAENFYIHEGAIICEKCINAYSDRLKISRGAISLYEKINNWQWNKLGRIIPSQKLIDELENIINLHIKYRIDGKIKTREFIESIKTQDIN